MYASEQAYSYPTTIPYIYTFQSWMHIILPLTLKVLANVSGHMLVLIQEVLIYDFQ